MENLHNFLHLWIFIYSFKSTLNLFFCYNPIA
ncbi:hypothetical protein BN8_04741 [Fibrisoma limi BUZ 3]|uniref:Uncharacterized protein n=1 Tax=Fibrisoma limi BUZ 3 TaxID=1185876 RepID=I2GNK4_9BACT|nr:hypothetical protein BN8_04741 [Fibrisoma limi BUZ 3]